MSVLNGNDLPLENSVVIFDGDMQALETALLPFYEANLMHTVFLGEAGLAHAKILSDRGYVNTGADLLSADAPDQLPASTLGIAYSGYLQSWHMESTERMRRFIDTELQLGDYKLRPTLESDKDLFIPYFNDPEVGKWMLMPFPFEEKDFTERLKRFEGLRRNGLGINWVIELDGVPQGGIACHHTDWEEKRTEIGYMAFPPSRGKGVIPTVLRSLVEFLFAEYGFERIEVRSDSRNESSRRAALKAGFTFEGELRRNFINKGEITDDAIFSIIPSDLAG